MSTSVNPLINDTNKPPQTVLAFDYGTKNIGVAVGQRLLKSARAAGCLKARDGIPNWEEIGKLIDHWQADILVVGLPLNMDGSESELAQRARKFGRRLHGRSGKPVDFVDERLSSNEAKARARETGHRGNYAEQPIDELAACVILEQWWREQ